MFGDVQNLQQPAPAHLPHPLTPIHPRAPARDLASPWTDAPFATVTSQKNPGALGVEQLEQHWSGVNRHASTFTNIARLFLRRGQAGHVLSCDFPGIVGVGVGGRSHSHWKPCLPLMLLTHCVRGAHSFPWRTWPQQVA